MNTNTFNYDIANSSISTIESLTDELQSVLNEMNAIIEENIDNPTVWKGESSAAFHQKWNTFAEAFPSFVTAFRKQKDNVRVALETNRAWEQQNM